MSVRSAIIEETIKAAEALAGGDPLRLDRAMFDEYRRITSSVPKMPMRDLADYAREKDTLMGNTPRYDVIKNALERSESILRKNDPKIAEPSPFLADRQPPGNKVHMPAALYFFEKPGGIDVPAKSWLADTADLARRTVFSIQDRHGTHWGTGSFLTEDGYFATAKHVAEQAGSAGSIHLADGRAFPWRLAAVNTSNDSAIGKVNAIGATKFDHLEIGSMLNLSSRRAAAFGYPGIEPLPLPVVAPGKFTGVGFDPDTGMTAFLNARTFPGHSGSPFMDVDGKFVGAETGGHDPRYLSKRTISVGGREPELLRQYSPPTANGPASEEFAALLNELRNRPKRDAVLRVRTKVMPDDVRSFRIVSEPEYVDLLSKPSLMRDLQEQYKVEVKGAHYWEDMIKRPNS